MSHGNAVSDIALVFNQAQDGLNGSGSQDRTSFDLFSAIDSVREQLIEFCKAHDKRLRLCVPCQHVNLAHPHSPHEEDGLKTQPWCVSPIGKGCYVVGC